MTLEQLAALRTCIGLAEEAIELRKVSDDEEDYEMIDAYEASLALAHAAVNDLEAAL